MMGLISKTDLEQALTEAASTELEQKRAQIQKEYDEKIKQLQAEQDGYIKAIEAEQKAKEEVNKRRENLLNLYKEYEKEFSSPDKLVKALKNNKDNVLDHVIVYFGLQNVSRKKVLTEIVSMFDKPVEAKDSKSEIAKLFNKAQGIDDIMSDMSGFVLNLNSSSMRKKTQSQSYSYKVRNDELVYLSVNDDSEGNYNAFSLFDVIYGDTRFQYSNGVDMDTLNTLGINLMSVVDSDGVKHWLVTHLGSKRFFVFDSLNTTDYENGAWNYSGEVPFLTKSCYFAMLLQAVMLLLSEEEEKRFTTLLRSGFYKYLELTKSGIDVNNNWFGMFQFMEVVENKSSSRNCIFKLSSTEPVCVVMNKEKTSMLSKSLINSFISYTLTNLFDESRTIEICKGIHMFGGYDEVSQNVNGEPTDVIKLI